MQKIKQYDYNSKVQLTKNINVSELKCKGTKHTHKIKVDVNHINNIQKFMDVNGYTKIVISSGHRCSEHNVAIGGSKNSQHTKGVGIDACFYKGSKKVPAKEVCCKAQDFGFKGIAYISTYYIHLDNRLVGTYRGDEREGYSNNVGGDFYKYFGIHKPTTYKGTFPTLPKVKYKDSKGKTKTRTWFKKGDTGKQVKNLQKFLNWALDLKLKVDGILGNDTLDAIEAFQKLVGIKTDRLFGKAALAEAKKLKK